MFCGKIWHFCCENNKDVYLMHEYNIVFISNLHPLFELVTFFYFLDIPYIIISLDKKGVNHGGKG